MLVFSRLLCNDPILSPNLPIPDDTSFSHFTPYSMRRKDLDRQLQGYALHWLFHFLVRPLKP